MSRKSQAMSGGQPAFSWRVERVEQPTAASAAGRFKCTCKNDPRVFAFGDTEEKAIRAANRAMETAVDGATVASAAPQVL